MKTSYPSDDSCDETYKYTVREQFTRIQDETEWLAWLNENKIKNVSKPDFYPSLVSQATYSEGCFFVDYLTREDIKGLLELLKDEPTKPAPDIGQKARVMEAMQGEVWRTLEDVSVITGDLTSSISACLRNFRKSAYGGHTLNRKHMGGKHHYQLVHNL